MLVLDACFCVSGTKCQNEVECRVELSRGQIRGLHIFIYSQPCFPTNIRKFDPKYKSGLRESALIPLPSCVSLFSSWARTSL